MNEERRLPFILPPSSFILCYSLPRPAAAELAAEGETGLFQLLGVQLPVPVLVEPLDQHLLDLRRQDRQVKPRRPRGGLGRRGAVAVRGVVPVVVSGCRTTAPEPSQAAAAEAQKAAGPAVGHELEEDDRHLVGRLLAPAD